MANGKYNWGLITKWILISSAVVGTFLLYGYRLEALEKASASTIDDHTKLQVMEKTFGIHIDEFKDFRTEQRKVNDKIDKKQDKLYDAIMKRNGN